MRMRGVFRRGLTGAHWKTHQLDASITKLGGDPVRRVGARVGDDHYVASLLGVLQRQHTLERRPKIPFLVMHRERNRDRRPLFSSREVHPLANEPDEASKRERIQDIRISEEGQRRGHEQGSEWRRGVLPARSGYVVA